ncbi:MAG: ABC transporter transmembrane domain-containing protein [Acidobacteriota bacterium]
MRPLRTLLPYVRPYLGAFLLSLVALGISAGAILALPIAIRRVIDEGLSSTQLAEVDIHFLGLLGLAIIYGVFTGVRMYLLNWLGERITVDLRNDLYARLLRFDITHFEEVSAGSLLTRLMADTTVLRTLAGSGFTVILRSSIILVGALTMLTATSWRLTILVLLLIGPMVLPVLAIGRRVRVLARVSQDEMARTGGVASETLYGIRTVQSYTLEALQIRRFGEAVWSTFVASKKRARMRALLVATSICSLFGTITVVLWLGVRSVVDGSLSGGMLGQYLLYALLVAHSAVALTEAWSELQRVAGASERLVELLGIRPRITSPSEPATMPAGHAAASIRYENVAFSYASRGDERALEGFDLSIAPGETVGLVGPSGAGKSTAVSLLLRFHDPTAGRILVNGVDIRTTTLEDLRSRIAIVPQETLIFATTAWENIRYGRPDASDDEVRAAARAAMAEEFILGLPDGYETFLGQGGSRLSGGQRQRMAIARAILRDPPILLLDEATNMLDSQNEDLVQRALDRLMRNRTTLIIAHRLATLRSADRIVVLDQGRIVDIGRHDELIERDDLYARLARLQLAG